MQLESLIRDLERSAGPRRSPLQRLGFDALARIRLFDVEAVGAGGEEWREELDALMIHLGSVLASMSDEFGARYFSHADGPQQLVRLV